MITNKKVIDFYQTNPTISVDHVNLFLVDMMEKMNTVKLPESKKPEAEHITIAFISVNKTHPTTQNFNLWGTQYWSDSNTNKSMVGDYFIFYVQKKYVHVHKIIRISTYSERPEIMKSWTGTTNIVYLSNLLQKYTWDIWNSTIGKGAPYTNAPGEKGYGSTHTTTWSMQQLKTKFPHFDIENFTKE